ncbi:hypothetical protein N0V93_006433 [Gnomoniopsis smithogilvyi]|uniref:Myb-like domain-containing protein n=1 Tax=Gnomoniopsis smithogilvyi TaxID=1191159 RepID=A0A9W9CVL1_9PEZI|nr:hypothetical protein N0V93_006433 [Gnomoniopsis smithogilvyi]
MPLSYGDLTVRGRDGRRVVITDCNLEPLNLLIPGNAPIVVPKKHAWRSPSQQTKMANRSHKLNVEVVQDDHGAESDQDEFDDETQPLIKSAQAKGKTNKSRCRKDRIAKEKAKQAKHLRKAERHEAKAELEREEAAGEHERLQKRIAEQEAYILRLKARYETAGEEANKGTNRKKARSEKEAPNNKKTAKASESDEGETTDGSAAVREMLANIKIRAGGKENPRFVAQPGELPWSISDDSQLIALKNDSDNSYAVIGECMRRGPGEVKRRYKYLKACDFKIPGGDETTEAEKTGEDPTDGEKTGEETTDVEQTGGETTDAEMMDDENKGDDDDDWSEKTDAQLWQLKEEGKTWAEIQAAIGKSKSGLKDRYKHLKNIDFKVPGETTDAVKPDEEKKDDKAPKLSSSSPAKSKKQGHSHEPSPAPSFAWYDADNNAYIAQYSRNLLAEANAGCTKIPEPDEIFDEDDCILLALADSRRRENRWLNIQADYFNVTGRMVPQEVLKWKLAGGEKPEDVDEED